MGRDKAALRLGNESLLGRTVRVAATAIPGPVAAIAPQPERYYPLLGPPWACHWVRETTAGDGAGPLRGIVQGLAYLQQQLQQCDWTLVLACDLPYLSATELAAWPEQLDRVPASAVALLPRGPKGWEPLCGFYRQEAAARLATYWDAGGRSLQTWLRQQSVATLEIGDRRTPFNCNTPAEWAHVTRNFALDGE